MRYRMESGEDSEWHAVWREGEGLVDACHLHTVLWALLEAHDVWWHSSLCFIKSLMLASSGFSTSVRWK